MSRAKGFLQATVIVLWTVYVLVRLASSWGRPDQGSMTPMAGVEYLEAYLVSLPIQSLVVSTGLMIAAVLGLEVAFKVIQRFDSG